MTKMKTIIKVVIFKGKKKQVPKINSTTWKSDQIHRNLFLWQLRNENTVRQTQHATNIWIQYVNMTCFRNLLISF